MRNNADRKVIRSFGVFSTLFLSLVGFGVFTYTKNIGKILGNNAFFPTIIYGIIYLAVIYIIYNTVKINNNNELNIIVENLFGKFIGRILLFLISIGIIFLISMQLRIFIDSIKLYIFPEINSEFMIGATLIICYYVVRFGDKVLTGINEIMFVFLLICCFVTFAIVCKNINLDNMLPMNIESGYIYLKGFLTFSSYFIGSMMLYYILPRYRSEGNEKVNVSYKSTILSFVFLSLLFLICVGILNINQSVKSNWPIIIAFTTIDVPGGFIERVEGIVITIATIFFIVNFINLYFYASYVNSKSLGLFRHKVSSTMFIPIIYILTLIPKGVEDIDFIINTWVFYISLILVFFVPVVLFLATYIKRSIVKGEGVK